MALPLSNQRITISRNITVMPTVAKTHADVELQRAEMRAVLASELFTRAPTLAHLLEYLCEKTFAGESSQIKEYSVGVDVFHRGPDFDQDSDSIVRVQANRLRKRLAEYYAAEGATHSLRITIPVGQYVPVFVPVASAGSISEPAPHGAVKAAWPLAGRTLSLAFGATALVLLGALIGAIVWVHRAGPKPPPAAAVPTSGSPLEPVGLPMGDELRILAGAGRTYVDHAGKLWSADQYFSGGAAVKSQVQHIWRTLDPSFYRTSRQGDFHYDLPLKKGVYELRLHFAETYYGPENIGSGGEGSRTINVSANGKPLLTSFDVVADAGGSGTADVKVFTGMQPASDGLLHLAFSSNGGNKAMLSAIEVLPGASGHIRPVRILARQSPYYSNDSHWWSPDAYFKGGQIATDTEPVRGTDDPELFETTRWGNFSYSIPVTSGRYSLALYFSARPIQGRSSETDVNGAESDRIFNVFCNGKAILQNFDLRKQAGSEDVVIRRFDGLEPNAQGKLLLEFVPVKGYATIAGLEVLPQ